MQIVDIATNLWKNELAEPTNVSIASISTYLRYNVGELNNLLGTCFTVDNSSPQSPTYLEIIDQNKNLIDSEASAIYKILYLINYYSRLIRNFGGVGGVNIVSSISSDNGVIKMVDIIGLAKLYLQMKKDCENNLKNMVNKYKFRNQTAVDVIGDDVFVSKQSYGLESQNQNGQLYENNLY